MLKIGHSHLTSRVDMVCKLRVIVADVLEHLMIDLVDLRLNLVVCTLFTVALICLESEVRA